MIPPPRSTAKHRPAQCVLSLPKRVRATRPLPFFLRFGFFWCTGSNRVRPDHRIHHPQEPSTGAPQGDAGRLLLTEKVGGGGGVASQRPIQSATASPFSQDAGMSPFSHASHIKVGGNKINPGAGLTQAKAWMREHPLGPTTEVVFGDSARVCRPCVVRRHSGNLRLWGQTQNDIIASFFVGSVPDFLTSVVICVFSIFKTPHVLIPRFPQVL